MEIMDKEKNESKIILRLICVFLTLVLIVCGLLFDIRLTEKQDAKYRLEPFVKEDTEYDVLFFGSSLMVNGVLPMELWDKYGITSFNIGGLSNTSTASYWLYRNAVEIHKPKVVVFDVKRLECNVRWMGTSMAHDTLDAFPLTGTKIEGVKDLFSDFPAEWGSMNEVLFEFIFPYALYHTRWDNIEYYMFEHATSKTEYSSTNGSMEMWEMATVTKEEKVPQDEYLEEPVLGISYFNQMVSYCKENDIELIFVGMPENIDEYEQLAHNKMYEFADVNNVDFINFQYADFISYDTDFCPDGMHLNRHGACKLTDYLGEYLLNNTGITDKRSNPEMKMWNDKYDCYEKDVLLEITSSNELKNALLGFYSANWTAEVEIFSSDMLTDEEVALISQLENVKVVETKTQEDNVVLRIFSNENGEEIGECSFLR